MDIRAGTPSDRDVLLGIWLRSVRATHTFLTEEDIQAFLPIVRDVALPNLELWVLETDSGKPMGFLGMDGSRIEALFLSPEFLRRGGGGVPVGHAPRGGGGGGVGGKEERPGRRPV